MNPLGNARAVFWAMVAACFAAAALGLLARAASFMADRWSQEATGVAVVRINGPGGEPDLLARAEATIAEAPHVAKAQIVTAERAAALVQDWGGAQVRPSDMPALQLVEVDFELGAPPDAPRQLEEYLTQQGLATRVVSPQAAQSVAAQNATLMRRAALGGAILLGLMMAAVVAFAARALALRRVDLITALADLGATRDRAGAEIGDEAARLGLLAGLVGALLAAGAGFATIYFSTPTATPLSILRNLSPFDWLPIVLTPPAAALFASLGARAGAGALHARAARLA